MLLVVFGAGATFDSWSSFPPGESPVERNRPPLAKDLFRARPLNQTDDRFRDVMRKFPKCFDVLPKLEAPPENSTVEHELEELQKEAPDNHERYRQLASIRFYLRDLIWECVGQWMGITRGASNYKVLLDSIRSAKYENKTCLVTFNYDIMLEDALQHHGMLIRTIEDYVAGPYKTVKLHGSVNWVHPVRAIFDNPVVRMSDEQVAKELIQKADQLHVEDAFQTVETPHTRIGDEAFLPALAIPTETKRNFECPPPHIEIMTKHLADVTKVLLIGWAGNEKNFLQLLAQNLRGAPKVAIVAGTIQGGKAVKEKLIKAGTKGTDSDFTNIKVIDSGFSNFVRGQSDRFLREASKQGTQGFSRGATQTCCPRLVTPCKPKTHATEPATTSGKQG